MEQEVTKPEIFSIEIDCPPGSPRPGDLLPGVLEGTGLTEEDFENTSRLFGNWEWQLSMGKNELYKSVRGTIKEKLVALYESGKARYVSW